MNTIRKDDLPYETDTELEAKLLPFHRPAQNGQPRDPTRMAPGEAKTGGTIPRPHGRPGFVAHTTQWAIRLKADGPVLGHVSLAVWGGYFAVPVGGGTGHDFMEFRAACHWLCGLVAVA